MAGTDRSDGGLDAEVTLPSREGSPLAHTKSSEQQERLLATPAPIDQGAIKITSKAKHSRRGPKQPTRFSPVKQRQIILQPYPEKVYTSHIREEMLEDQTVFTPRALSSVNSAELRSPRSQKGGATATMRLADLKSLASTLAHIVPGSSHPNSSRQREKNAAQATVVPVRVSVDMFKASKRPGREP